MNEATNAPSEPTVEDLDAIEREILASREELADLQRRTRVIDVESSSWRITPMRVRSDGGALPGFFFGLFVVMFLGRFLAKVVFER
jgi:hypothetical protein